MSIYLFLYLIIAFFMLFISIKVLKNYIKYSYGKYFFISIFSYFLWIIIYISSFTITYDKDILLLFSRLLYSLFLIGLYSMLLFIILFNNKKDNIKIHFYIIFSLLIFFIIGVFTPFIIESLQYSTLQNIYIEKFGILYSIYAIAYIISPLLIIFFSYKKLKQLNTINKIRLKYIVIGFLSFCLGEWLFLVILPLFNIWILQKEQVLFFIPFIIGIYYSNNRYHFLDIKIGILKIITYLISILLSGITTFFIYKLLFYYYSDYKGDLILLFGKQNKYLSVYDLFFYMFISILLFIIYKKVIQETFKYNISGILLNKKLNRLKRNIPHITNVNNLNRYLNLEFSKILNIKYIEISIINYNNTEIKKYFHKTKLNNIFINDIVFIEEKKHKFNYKLLKEEINNKSYLIFPIKNNENELIGTFSIGTKSFGDSFYTEEIAIIKEFVGFLEGHIKYIGIYSEINNLNLNLDKLIDEKTIEYNILINKQKEFIGYISHEIKTPIANSIFQADCIIDNIKEGNYNNKALVKDINLINSQLLKSGNLLNKLFDIEKYDNNKSKLYKEKVNLNNFLEKELSVLKKIKKNIQFDINITKSDTYIYIDIIQFTQVLDNLLNNAIKFSNPNEPIIRFTNYTLGDYIYIVIEDNGLGFIENDIKTIFNKYSTGENSFTGLGMGLYLCKKIVEMHNGEISANISSTLGGAKFIIKLLK